MKNKIKNVAFLIMILSAVFSFSGVVEAACCVSDCSAPAHDGKCPGMETPDSKDCSEIESCKDKADDSKTGTVTKTLPNPIGFDSLEGLLNSLLSHLRGIVGVLAILFIVLGGVMYILSAGNPKMIERAKACWTAAVIGLAIVIAAPSFLKEIKEVLGGDTTGLEGLTVKEIAYNVLKLLLSLAGILAIISLVLGGSMLMTTYVDTKQAETAKKVIYSSVIGIIVVMAALVIVRQVAKLIGG